MKAGASAALNIASATAVSEGAAKSLDILRKRTLGRRSNSGSDKSDKLEEKPAAVLPMSELKVGDELPPHTSVSPSIRHSVSSMQSMDSVSDGDDIHRGLEMTDDEDDESGGGSQRFLKTPQLK